MATPTSDPEIQLDLGIRLFGNAVALFGSYIFVIGSDYPIDMQQSLYATTGGFTATGLGDKTNWSSSRLTLPESFAPQGAGPCALAIQSAETPALYLFWNQPNAGLMATSLTDVTGPSQPQSSQPIKNPTAPTPVWSAGLVLGDEFGGTLQLPEGTGVSAVSLGSEAFLVAFVVEVPIASGKHAQFATVALYYVADQKPTSTIKTKAGTFGMWPSRGMLALSASEIGALLPPVAGRSGDSLGYLISIAVTPQVNAPDSSGSNLALSLVMFLTVTMADDKGSDKTPLQVALTCPLDETGSPEGGTPSVAWSSPPSTQSPLTVLSDPAGRIIAVGSSVTDEKDEQKALLFEVFATYGPLAKVSQSVLPAPSADTSSPANMIFVIDTSNATQSAGPNEDGSGTMTTTSYPLVQLLFYGMTVAQVQPFGTAETVANYANMLLSTPANGPAIAVTGIIEGPIPLPNANIAGWQFESTVNDLGSVVYGVAQGATNAVQQESNIGASMTTDGKIGVWAGAESLGDGGSAGFAWDASLSGGFAKTWSSSTAGTLAQPLQQPAIVTVDQQMIGQSLVPYGSIFAAPSSLSITNLRFLDAQGNVISDGTQNVATAVPQAPIFAATTATVGQSDQYNYVPFLVTPGDLMTYTIDGTRPDGTPCGINATMAALTNNAIADYFDSIIWPAAFDFGAAAGQASQRYLDFSWSIGGLTADSFMVVGTSFHSSSWNIAASLALGYFWDDKAGAPLLGGVQSSGSIMLGVSDSYSRTTSSTQTSQWGVSVQPYSTSPPWGPPNWGTPPNTQMQAANPDWENSVIARYRFALFLLPDPQAGDPSGLSPGYWVQELITYGNQNAATVNPNATLPVNLDHGSGCWKIVYVVLEIQTYADMNSGSYTYRYTDPKGRFG